MPIWGVLGRFAAARALAAALGFALAVAGAAGVWEMTQKAITVDVDGRVSTTRTHAGSVARVLSDLSVQVSAGDEVSPTIDGPIHDGDFVVVRHLRQVEVTLDGAPVTVSTTAASVGELLDQLDARQASTPTSSRSLLREGEPLSIATRKDITLVIDGAERHVSTYALRVGELLEAERVTVTSADRVEPALTTLLTAASTVRVDHIQTTTAVDRVPVPAGEQTVEDRTAPAGTRTLARAGTAGERTITSEVDTLAGVEVARRTISDEVTTAPVDAVWSVGTKKTVAAQAPTADASDVRALGASMAADRGWTGEQWTCLEQLWDHESGWSPTAGNPTSSAYGIPQALPGSKMASAGADWRTNAATQITWGLGYIADRYTTPCGALTAWSAKGWY